MPNRKTLVACVLTLLWIAVLPARAQQSPAGERSVVVRAHGPLALDGAAGLTTRPAAMRAYQASPAGRVPASEALREQDEEVTTEAFKRGALVGGTAGLVAGALVGALLGGSENTARWEAALPGALAGLAVGTPVGVYVQSGQPPRYLWGVAGVAGAAAVGTAVYYVESD